MASRNDSASHPFLNLRSWRNSQLNPPSERLHVPFPGDDGGELGTLEGYAAIDPGSTGTRAVIATTQVDQTTGKRDLVKVYRIQDFREDDDSDRRFKRGEWPSKCCPFDGPPYHVGYDAAIQDERRTISIKAIPYFRTQDDDGHPFTKALYDHSNSLPSEIEKEDFNDVLDSILFTFFDQVVQQILKHCEKIHVKLRSLALCVPQTWSRRETPIQEYLSPIIDKTVTGQDVETLFALEAQCQAQFLIHRHPQDLRNCNELMVLDFGGHSMGGSDSEIHWGPGVDRPRFHATPRGDFGVRGGYELWELGIGRCIDRAMGKNPKRYPLHKRHVIRSRLLESFFNSKSRISLERPHRLNADLVGDFGDSRASYTVTITAEQLKREWESAFREPINLATQNIRRVAMTGRRVQVLLTGGSANSRNLRDEIKDVCARLCDQGVDITCKNVAKELDVVMAPKWSIAEGAACCHALAMEVEEFFDLGAALAVQTWTTTDSGGQCGSDTGELLFCKENGGEWHGSIDVEIAATKMKFRIIANPFQMAPQGRGASSKSVLVRQSYDVWDIVLEYLPSSGVGPLPIPNGKHILEVAEMVYNSREAILVLRMRPNFSPGSRRSERILRKHAIDQVYDWSLLFQVPLTSCGPSNLVELDIDLVRGRFWTLEEDENGSHPIVDRESREASVELGTPSPPPAKRRKGSDGFFRVEVDSRDDFGLR